MKYIEITQVYEDGMLKYPSTGDFKLSWDRDYSLGQDMAMTHFETPTHLGTHLDSPYHMIENGIRMEDIPMDYYIGKVQVITIKGKDFIDAKDLEKIEIEAPRLIFKTDNYERITHGNFENVYFTPAAGEYMASKGVKLVGLDYFGVDKKGDKTRQAHKSILGNNMSILEGIFPQDVKDGIYFLMCLPLRIKSIEGCPCRALLFEYDEIKKIIDNKE